MDFNFFLIVLNNRSHQYFELIELIELNDSTQNKGNQHQEWWHIYAAISKNMRHIFIYSNAII